MRPMPNAADARSVPHLSEKGYISLSVYIFK